MSGHPELCARHAPRTGSLMKSLTDEMRKESCGGFDGECQQCIATNYE